MFFSVYKDNFGSDRIGMNIGPDTYAYVYMETALLRPGTLNFLDKYGYYGQNTKEFKSFDELVNELRRLIKIYTDL